ncbi:hypothetical protein D9M69_595470 [compost metagenome]
MEPVAGVLGDGGKPERSDGAEECPRCSDETRCYLQQKLRGTTGGQYESGSERQPGGTGLERAELLDLLEVEGDDIESAHRANGEQEHGGVGAGTVAVSEEA